MLARRGNSKGSISASTSSLKNAGFQIAAPRAPASDDSNVLTQVLYLAREGMRDPNSFQRVAGLEMVMLGGKALVMQEPKILSEVAQLTSDADHEVSKSAYRALEHLETELSRSDIQRTTLSPPGSAPADCLMLQTATSSRSRPYTADFSLLDRLGSFNRRLPGEKAMEALSGVILGDESAKKGSDIGRLDLALVGKKDPAKEAASKELRNRPGVAKEVLPHLTDAVRASREAPIRKAAADALLKLASGSQKAEHGKGVDLEVKEEAMDCLSAALRARSGKLLHELENLAPKL